MKAANSCGTSSNSAATLVTTLGTQGTYVVSSLANGTTGDGISLRWAITAANANCGHDIIRFNLGGGGPYTINLTSALPNLTDNDGVTIDGWNNTLNSGTPNTVPVFNATTTNPLNPVYKVILGNGGTVATGLILASNNNVIQGLVLQDFGDGAVSGNDIAITISGNNNQVLGCYIGVDITGTTRGVKTADGIVITGANNEIGDGTAAGANLISGLNGNFEGIWINGNSATGNSIKGNMIGLQKDGTTIVAGASQFSGVFISSSAISNIIGGSLSGEGNVISGNNSRGVYLNTTSAGGNIVKGNIIGPAADGLNYVASNPQLYGIMVSGSPDNLIGGNTPSERNIISANETYGIDITGAGSTGNEVKGNYIGTNISGTGIISGSTQDYGVGIISFAGNNFIGGNLAGEGNVISGNKDGSSTARGIFINSTAVAGNSVVGNIIGPQADGVTYFASNAQSRGIEISNSPNNTIGGNTTAERNIISANETYGVYITGGSSTGNTVKGNYIGIAQNGTTFITGSTQDYGVFITTSAAGNTIGGSGAGEGNVISGNKDGTSTGRGIYFTSAAVAGNSILGNIIGPQADGITYLASNGQFRGIEINGSQNNSIGGNTSNKRNIISGNETYGLYFSGAGSSGNTVKGNYIGPSSTLTSITGASQDYGIYIFNSALNNIIGNGLAGEPNTIAFNSINGIFISDVTTTGNKISSNSMYQNTGKPININYGGSQGNLGKAFPVITSATANDLAGTSEPLDVIEVFKNNSGNCFDASTFLGMVTANISGNWTIPVSLFPDEYVLATSTSAANNTSEFSTCILANVDLYWVGGNGLWNVASNWSNSSGGPGGAGVPSINTNVFLDNFSGAVTITIPSGTWYTKNFNMSGNGVRAIVIGLGVLLPRP